MTSNKKGKEKTISPSATGKKKSPEMETIAETKTGSRALWVPIDRALRKIDAASGPQRKIYVIGAGMAGLAAAYELMERGHQVELYEGSGRAGGRVETHRFGDGTYSELGAMAIPITHDYTWHYIRKFQLEERKFLSSHGNGVYFVKGKRKRMKDFVKSVLPLFKKDLKKWEREKIEAKNTSIGPGILLGMLNKVIDKLTDIERSQLLAADMQSSARLRSLDKLSMLDFLKTGSFSDWPKSRPLSPGALELLRACMSFDCLWNWSLAEVIRNSLSTSRPRKDKRHLMWEIKGGLDLLPKALGQALQSKIHYNMRIDGITVESRGTTKFYGQNTVTKRPFEVNTEDPVLCTIPFTVLRELELRGLTLEKEKAIKGLEYAGALKVSIHYKTRFWELDEKPIVGGMSITDMAARQTLYPCDNIDWADPGLKASTLRKPRLTQVSLGPGAITASYLWGSCANVLGSKPHHERVKAVTDSLCKLHGSDIDQYHQGDYSRHWNEFEWARGAFALTPPCNLTSYAKAARQNEGNLFFAGEHVSIAPGWIQGALESGLREAERMLL